MTPGAASGPGDIAARQKSLINPSPRCTFANLALRMRPAGYASGDFAYFWSCESGRTWHGVVGDVAGHDLKAADTALTLLEMLDARKPANPVVTLADIHHSLEHSGQGRHATAIAFLLTSEGQLTVTSAAHPSAIWLRHGEETLSLPETSGDPLGLFEDRDPDTPCTRQLRDGDRFILLSDGLLERPGAGTQSRILPAVVLRRVAESGFTHRLTADTDLIWSLLRNLNHRFQPVPDDQTLALIEYRRPRPTDGV